MLGIQGLYEALGKDAQSNIHEEDRHACDIRREQNLLVSQAAATVFLLGVWWNGVDVYIFSPSINWTLSSWLMCSQSLLDLDQLGSSRVKTTGVRDGRRERKRQGSRAAGSLWKTVRQTTVSVLAKWSNGNLKLKCWYGKQCGAAGSDW